MDPGNQSNKNKVLKSGKTGRTYLFQFMLQHLRVRTAGIDIGIQ